MAHFSVKTKIHSASSRQPLLCAALKLKTGAHRICSGVLPANFPAQPVHGGVAAYARAIVAAEAFQEHRELCIVGVGSHLDVLPRPHWNIIMHSCFLKRRDASKAIYGSAL